MDLRRPTQVLDITTSEEFTLAMTYPGLVVIEAYAVWCGPCLSLAPYLKEILVLGDDKIPPVFIYRSPASCVPHMGDQTDQAYDSCPTIMFFKNGQLVHKLRGPDGPGVHELCRSSAPTYAEFEVYEAPLAVDTDDVPSSSASDTKGSQFRRINDCSLEVTGCFNDDALLEY